MVERCKGATRMPEQYENGGKLPGVLGPPSRQDPCIGLPDPGLLGRLAEEMYGELAFARAANAHPRSTRESLGRLPPSSDPGAAKDAHLIRAR